VIPDGVAAAVALAVDRAVGEPPARWHPVAWFGTAMTRLERRTYRDSRAAGIVHLTAGAGIGVAAGALLRRGIGRPAATLVATTVAVAGRMLADEAAAVARPLAAGDLDAARTRLAGLVGRDVTGLDRAGIARAVVETVAENTVDAVTAPLWWASVGGAPAVLAHRAINTLDAMVGHRHERYVRFGWASARADDLANWLPARLTAIAVMAVRPARASDIIRTVRRDAPRHPSPNGGVAEAAFASAVGIRLGGSNTYGAVVEDRGTLGDGRAPAPNDVASAIVLARDATAVLGSVIAVAALVARRARCGPR
jgi:adenosylcobinamide-phosphate synthase